MDAIFPKDIVMYIYQIVHKDIMTDLNYEYRVCVEWLERGEKSGIYGTSIKYYGTSCHKMYNYRQLKKYTYTSGYARNQPCVYNLPSKYRYSRGMS